MSELTEEQIRRQAIFGGPDERLPEEGIQVADFNQRRNALTPFLDVGGFSERAIPSPPVEEAKGLWESFEAGWEQSNTGLVFSGESPDTILAEDASRAERLTSITATVLGDLPTLILGGIGGGIATTAVTVNPIAGVAGSGAGAFGLTEGTRTWLLEQYASGHSKKTISERLAATAWATAKGATIGAFTGGAGGKTAQVATQVGLGSATKFTAVTAAEVTTMVTVAHALEGELPDADDFLDGAILLAGFKGSIATASKLRSIYARTGKTPKEVVADAAKDSQVWQQVIDPRMEAIPEIYRANVKSPLRINQNKNIEVQLDPKIVNDILNPVNQVSKSDRQPHQLNHDLFDMKGGPKRTADQLAKTYELEMKESQGGKVPWKQSDVEAATFLRELLGEEGLKSVYAPGSAKWTAEIRARKEITTMLLNETWQKANALNAKGSKATPTELLDLMASVERTRQAQAVFTNRKAEAGRALQKLKDTSRIKEIEIKEAEALKGLSEYGGKTAVEELIKVTQEITSPVELGRILSKPTTFEMIVEGWKSFMVSGPSTQQVNFLGNIMFAATRVPKEIVAATYGKLKPNSPERVAYTDAIALTNGLVMGAFDSITLAGKFLNRNITEQGFSKGLWEAYKSIDVSKKGKQEIQPKIPGALGQVIRGPFKVLTLTDGLARSMNSRASLYTEASRQALSEGKKPFSKEYNQRVNELVKKPTEEMTVAAEADALRYVFLEEGPIIKALENLRHELPGMHLLIPFLRAPGGIFREFFRHSPMAPIIKQWRADFRKGGVAKDRAIAEVTMGTALSVPLFLLAQEGSITGAGHPDRKKKRAQYNAGFQPYSFQTSDGEYISYNRYEPAGTLIGLTADVSQAWDLMNDEEQDKAAEALMWAAVEVVKNKTWLKSTTAFINAIQDPYRYGNRWAESFVGSFVPGILGQPAREMDPYVREIDGVVAAVQSRIPGVREDLPIMIDDFGEEVLRAEPLWPGSPSTVRPRSSDPVRLEAERLGVSTSGTPDKLSAGSLIGQSARVELDQEQKGVYARQSGRLAHQLMEQAINNPGWAELNPLVQRRYFERAFTAARQRGAIMALPPEQRVQAINELRLEHGL